MEKLQSETFRTYKPVEQLEKGTTVVNLGIIKRIFNNPVNNTIKLTFQPCREALTEEIDHYYHYGDRLMTA